MVMKLIDNIEASAVPLILFFMTIFLCGGIYTLLFIEFGIPLVDSWVSSSDSKTFIMMGIYAIPLIILVVGVVWLIIQGLKSRGWTMGGN